MKKINSVVFSIFIFLVIVSPLFVLAQGTGSGSGATNGGTGSGSGAPTSFDIKIDNPLKNGTNTLYDFIVTIIKDIILPLGGVVAVLSIIYAGFMLVTARGDETKLKTAKKAFTYAAIGALVLLGAWAIAQAIQGTINQLTGN